jgi:2-polyprenyl-3-methyl-5-hydroxy-6-metoxy-1,4-benzoquinol methylase
MSSPRSSSTSPFAWTRKLATDWGGKKRQERYRLFLHLCAVTPQDSIVDIGSGAGGSLATFNTANLITAVDVQRWPNDPDRPNVTFVQADGTALPFPDRAFDVGFSNSVIEHVPPDKHRAFAAEIRRVAERYFVQTPNRWFPIEPHYQLPFFQFLPRRVRMFLNAHFSLGWQRKGSWEEITLLSARDLERLFPDAEIHRERVFGVTKSLMAVRAARRQSVTTTPTATHGTSRAVE